MGLSLSYPTAHEKSTQGQIWVLFGMDSAGCQKADTTAFRPGFRFRPVYRLQPGFHPQPEQLLPVQPGLQQAWNHNQP